jgi:molybdate transport system ATP-binding protein
VDPILDARFGFSLSRLDLAVELAMKRETLALVGPSGAGKTSALRAIAGLRHVREGRIAFAGATWVDTARGIDLPSERRRVGMVFQEGALFPHLTVAGNVRFGRRRGRVDDVLERFGIRELASAHPRDLSGGERQRVALARAVASDPVLLLLDEPVSSLDAATKAAVSAELLAHLRALGLPAILVSHDFGDVLGMADRIAVMEAGRIVQVGSGRELLEAPASPFVAALTGVNFFDGVARRRGELTEVHAPGGGARFLSTDPADGPVGVAVPPWEVALSLSRPEGSALNALAGAVRRIAGVGNRVRVTVGSDPPVVAEVTDESVHRMGLAPGVRVVATWKATGTRLVPR